MSFPNIPNITPSISLSLAQTIPLLLGSIAVEELALAHLMNTEAEKVQFVLGTLTPTTVTLSPPRVTITDLLTVNTSVQRTMQDIIKKEILLEFKFENVLNLLTTIHTPAPPVSFTRILAAGGVSDSFQATANSEIYNRISNTWSPTAPISEPREGYAGSLLPDGRVIVSHGETEAGGTLYNSVRFYDVVTNTWSPGPSAAVNRSELMGTVLGGKFYAVGGWNDTTVINTVELFDPVSNTWSLGSSTGLTPRNQLGVVTLNGRIHAIGGSDNTDGAGTPMSIHEVFDPITNVWTPLTSLPTPLKGLYSTVVFNGKIYVLGGFGINRPSATVFIYDPATNIWSSGAAMPTARGYAGAAVSGNEIFVMGGFNGFSFLNTVEAYNPATDSWRTVSSMSNIRGEFPGISLP